jgi:hypothetical protein
MGIWNQVKILFSNDGTSPFDELDDPPKIYVTKEGRRYVKAKEVMTVAATGSWSRMACCP